jgi:hypothetical protein
MSPAAVKAAVMDVEVCGEFAPVPFDEDGNLTWFRE